MFAGEQLRTMSVGHCKSVWGVVYPIEVRRVRTKVGVLLHAVY